MSFERSAEELLVVLFCVKRGANKFEFGLDRPDCNGHFFENELTRLVSALEPGCGAALAPQVRLHRA